MTRRAPSARSERVSPPGPAPISITVAWSSGPAARAMRPVRFKSRMKFCPRLFRAAMPCRAMISRSGGNPAESTDATDPEFASSGAEHAIAPCRHLGGEPQRGDQAVGPRDAASSDVKGGAVIGRGADERKPERHIDRAVEIDRLHRDQRLVVIHAQCGVIAAARL